MKKVLIMEDELNIRSFVVINLKRAGYDVIEAGTGTRSVFPARYSAPNRASSPVALAYSAGVQDLGTAWT